jgi:hypothetical protein
MSLGDQLCGAQWGALGECQAFQMYVFFDASFFAERSLLAEHSAMADQ